jgi:MATE family multidrug resistance protein
MWLKSVSFLPHLFPHFFLSFATGMAVYQSINSFCFMVPTGFSIATSARVGNLLGAGNPIGAAFAAKVGVASAAAASFALGCFLFYTPHTFIPSLFAPDQEDVILEAAKTIPLLAIYVFGDGVAVALNGVIKGCGRQQVEMQIVIVAYWVVAVPLAYYLAFVKNSGEMSCEDSYFCGVVGLVAAMTTGTWIHMLLLAVVVGCTTNWTLESEKAKARLAEKE